MNVTYFEKSISRRKFFRSGHPSCEIGIGSEIGGLSERDRLWAWGPFLTLTLGANFDPRGGVVPQGEFCPQGVKSSPGVKFSVRPPILLNSRECSPLGVNEGVNIPPRGQISPLGARGEVKNGPLVYLWIRKPLLPSSHWKWERWCRQRTVRSGAEIRNFVTMKRLHNSSNE
jgi:hypothetical protein